MIEKMGYKWDLWMNSKVQNWIVFELSLDFRFLGFHQGY